MSGQKLRAWTRTPLRGFDLDLELSATAGDPLALVGRSGAGKTSMLRAIAGLLSPRRGRVELDGLVWLDSELGVELAAERRRCGFLFQDYALFPRMSAWRNVAYGMPEPRRRRRAEAMVMLERFDVGHLAEARPSSLSGGERQRVALARALAARPRALLLDEPLAALDSTTRRAALAELRRVLAKLAAPVVVVTHSFEEAALLGSSLAVIELGRVVQRGTAAEISARPASPFVAAFTGAVVLFGEASDAGNGLTAVRLDGGGEIRSVDRARGRVAVSVFPWEISLEDPEASGADSTLNRLAGEVETVSAVGNRTRVGIASPQVLTAELTSRSAARLGLRPGARVVAAWKAAATRTIPLD